jgi:nucleoside 2-deoxyribosyltransferase
MRFYVASKIWHADKIKHLRDTVGMPVQARWIDLTQESDLVQNRKDVLWQMCYEDVRDSDFVLLYCEDMSEEQRGALVEVGMAFGMGKPVYAVGRCNSICPNGISDVAFTHHHLWTWLDSTNLVKGAFYAIATQMGRNRARESVRKVA